MHGLINNVEKRYVGAAVTAGSSIDTNSSIIDMADYESVMFITTITDSVDTGVAAMEIQESDENSDTAMAAIDGTAVEATSDGNDALNGTLLCTEIIKPSKRYVQATRTSSTANIAYGTVIALLVPKRLPAEDGDTVSASASVSN